MLFLQCHQDKIPNYLRAVQPILSCSTDLTYPSLVFYLGFFNCQAYISYHMFHSYYLEYLKYFPTWKIYLYLSDSPSFASTIKNFCFAVRTNNTHSEFPYDFVKKTNSTISFILSEMVFTYHTDCTVSFFKAKYVSYPCLYSRCITQLLHVVGIDTLLMG